MYSNLRVSSADLRQGRHGDGERGREEHGRRDGEEVVQLYVAHVGSKVARPHEELKGFSRVAIRAGETATVAIPLKASRWRTGTAVR